jgi:hypothetical protein
MAVASRDNLIETATALMGGSADTVDSTALEYAADQAISETSWAFPIADGIKSFWIIERTRRHILQILANVAAMKFQYKQIHLEHRFKHLIQMIEKLDSDFFAFASDNPELFVDAMAALDENSLEGFMTYISNGFEYDLTGIEL